jgi:hypothetical protein
MKKTLILRNFGLSDRNPTKHDGSDWSDSRFFVWREGGTSCSTYPTLSGVKPRRDDTYAIDCETWDVHIYHQRRWILIGNSSAFHEAWKAFRQADIKHAETTKLRHFLTNFPHLFKEGAAEELEAMERARPRPVHPPFRIGIDFELP